MTAVDPGSARGYLAEVTRSVVFDQLWARPALAPRDRSLGTLSIMFAMRMPDGPTVFHIRRGIENGLTRAEIEELALQATFYAGWPCGNRALDLISGALDGPAPDPGGPASAIREHPQDGMSV